MANFRHGTQYARTTIKTCPMADDACAAAVIARIAERYGPTYGACDCGWSARYIGALVSGVTMPQHAAGCASVTPIPFDAAKLVESACGRFVRGKHAGKLRGWAKLVVVVEGGWHKDGPGERNGHVVRPGAVLSITIEDFHGKPYLTV